jgi:hypothetical protein
VFARRSPIPQFRPPPFPPHSSRPPRSRSPRAGACTARGTWTRPRSPTASCPS